MLSKLVSAFHCPWLQALKLLSFSLRICFSSLEILMQSEKLVWCDMQNRFHFQWVQWQGNSAASAFSPVRRLKPFYPPHFALFFTILIYFGVWILNSFLMCRVGVTYNLSDKSTTLFIKPVGSCSGFWKTQCEQDGLLGKMETSITKSSFPAKAPVRLLWTVWTFTSLEFAEVVVANDEVCKTALL